MNNHLSRIILLFSVICFSNLAFGQAKSHVTSRPLPQNVPSVTLSNWQTITPDTTAAAEPSLLFMPLIFSDSKPTDDTCAEDSALTLNADDEWLTNATREGNRVKQIRRDASIANPQYVKLHEDLLPEPPKQYEISPDPTSGKLPVAKVIPPPPVEIPVDDTPVKIHNWIHSFDGSLHFNQAYVSSNWYQGGNNNLSILGDIKWEFNLNPNIHPNITFTNLLHYRVGIMTAHNDEYRKVAINEDNFQFNSTIGYKAVKKWYYSASLQVKTQFFKSYKENTMVMKSAFLTPAELNLGLGMTYTHENKEKDQKFSLAINPFSYNMKYCRDIDNISPTTFGIDEGKHFKHDFGSSINGSLKWKITPYITWSAQFDFFTNYKYVQANWQNTFDFYVTRHLSTQIYTHLRFDRTHPRDDKWHYFQFRETLSFGLTYRFATI